MASIKGLDSFFDVIEVVKDPAKYEAKVAELKGLISQYTEVVEAVVALANVNDYTQNIKKREAETKEVLAQAKQSASDTITKAAKKADKIVEDAREKEKEAVVKLADLEAKQAAFNEQVRSWEEKVEDERKRERKLEEAEKKHEQAVAELKARQAKLQEALK